MEGDRNKSFFWGKPFDTVFFKKEQTFFTTVEKKKKKKKKKKVEFVTNLTIYRVRDQGLKGRKFVLVGR